MPLGTDSILARRNLRLHQRGKEMTTDETRGWFALIIGILSLQTGHPYVAMTAFAYGAFCFVSSALANAKELR